MNAPRQTPSPPLRPERRRADGQALHPPHDQAALHVRKAVIPAAGFGTRFLPATKAVAKEVASRGITVNAVAPGFIDTEMTKSLPQKIRDLFLNQIPLGRTGRPEDVANLVFFLCTEEAGYITGQAINVDGGMLM